MSDTVLIDNRENSEAIAKNINGLSEKIDENFTKASNLFLNGDPSEWAGKDADSYKQKLQDLKVKVTSSIEDVKKLSNQIERTSSQIHEQDTQNEGTAKNL
jgi:hypothetical protein